MSHLARRAGAVVAGAAAIGCVVAAGPADAAAQKGPKLGDWTCTVTSTASVNTLTLKKGNKYSVDGGSKGKYVYKSGHKTLHFKSGDWNDHYATFDPSTSSLTLYKKSDDSVDGGCLQLS